MKPGCYNCRTGKCYHIDDSRALEVQELKDRIEMVEEAVNILEKRLSALIDVQYIEPYYVELSEEDTNKIKKWLSEET